MVAVILSFISIGVIALLLYFLAGVETEPLGCCCQQFRNPSCQLSNGSFALSINCPTNATYYQGACYNCEKRPSSGECLIQFKKLEYVIFVNPYNRTGGYSDVVWFKKGDFDDGKCINMKGGGLPFQLIDTPDSKSCKLF